VLDVVEPAKSVNSMRLVQGVVVTAAGWFDSSIPVELARLEG
jgi:hypothetical protein